MAHRVVSLRCQRLDAIGGEADKWHASYRWLASSLPPNTLTLPPRSYRARDRGLAECPRGRGQRQASAECGLSEDKRTWLEVRPRLTATLSHRRQQSASFSTRTFHRLRNNQKTCRRRRVPLACIFM